jgi:hypothetical protein
MCMDVGTVGSVNEWKKDWLINGDILVSKKINIFYYSFIDVFKNYHQRKLSVSFWLRNHEIYYAHLIKILEDTIEKLKTHKGGQEKVFFLFSIWKAIKLEMFHE